MAWDRAAQEHGIGRAEFMERSGRILANAHGRGWWEWDGREWVQAQKPGPKAGPRVGMYRWPAFDVFSTDFTGYRNVISAGAAKVFGRDWAAVIERAYGSGAVDRILSQLWRNLWTDLEGLGEVGHYYDASRQMLDDGLPAPAYNLQIGPRYDVPKDLEGDEADSPWDQSDRFVRRQRVTDPLYFDRVWSSS